MTAGLSAFAAVQHVKKASEPPSTPSTSPVSSLSSTAGSKDVLPITDEPLSLLSERSAKPSSAPESVTPFGRESVLARIKQGQNLTVIGVFSLWVKRGQVSLWGAILQASSFLHHVFVPITHAIPCITSTVDCAEVVISSSSSGVRYLGYIERHFAGIWGPDAVNPQLSFHVLDDHSAAVQDAPAELRYLALGGWLPAIHAVSQGSATPRILVSGARRTGKSTLCRCLVNNMLSVTTEVEKKLMRSSNDGVMFLDLDPGQPELAAPGIIYLAHIRRPLLGPSFTNIILPDSADNTMLRMHYIGASTPRESPSHYLRCVRDLWSLYCKYEHIPLVINTCGWTTGSGKDILLSVVRAVILTSLIYLGDERSSPWNHAMFTDLEEKRKPVTLVPCQPKQNSTRSGRDLREMQMQAYIHAVGLANGQIIWDQMPISMLLEPAAAAWEISDETPLVVILGEEIVPEYVADALHNSVAATVIIKHGSPLHHLPHSPGPDKSEDDGQQQMHIAHTCPGHIPYLVYDDKTSNPLDPATTECLGLGLVRVTVSDERRFRVRSPVSSAHIKRQLAKGYRVALVLAKQQDIWANLETPS